MIVRLGCQRNSLIRTGNRACPYYRLIFRSKIENLHCCCSTSNIPLQRRPFREQEPCQMALTTSWQQVLTHCHGQSPNQPSSLLSCQWTGQNRCLFYMGCCCFVKSSMLGIKLWLYYGVPKLYASCGIILSAIGVNLMWWSHFLGLTHRLSKLPKVLSPPKPTLNGCVRK